VLPSGLVKPKKRSGISATIPHNKNCFFIFKNTVG
jgi:hypothetical protein